MDNAAKEAYLAGVAKARAGDPVAAAAAFTEALDREPAWTQARLSRGVAFFLTKNYPAALADFDAALVDDPNLVDGYLNRSAVRRAIADNAGADADLAKAVDLAPDNPAVIQSRGNARLRGGNAAGAVRDFTRVLELTPKLVVALVNRAAAFIQLGELQAAIADTDEALSIDPKNRDAAINRATARLMLRDHAGAEADAAIVLGNDRHSVEGLYIRGVARTGLEQFIDALTDLDDVVRRAPNLAAAWAARGNVKYHLNDATAVNDYREAFKLDAVAATRVLVRVVRDQAKNRPVEVLAECNKYRARDRRDVISLARRALTRLAQGRTADANLDFAAFRKAAPDDLPILDQLIAAVSAAELAKKSTA